MFLQLYVIIGIPLPLGAVTILLVDLGTDIVPSIALAYESPETDIMKRKPRNPLKDRLVSHPENFGCLNKLFRFWITLNSVLVNKVQTCSRWYFFECGCGKNNFDLCEGHLWLKIKLNSLFSCLSAVIWTSLKQVGRQLIERSYGQIGMVEAAAGMLVYFVIFAKAGFGFSRLINIRREWESPAVTDLVDDYGQGERKSRSWSNHTLKFAMTFFWPHKVALVRSLSYVPMYKDIRNG